MRGNLKRDEVGGAGENIVLLHYFVKEREIYTNILGAYKDANEMRLSISV